MRTKKTPSKPIHERNTHDWARRVLAQRLAINTKFMRSTEQWYAIVSKLANMQDNGAFYANSQ